jgi:hypothetical protein
MKAEVNEVSHVGQALQGDQNIAKKGLFPAVFYAPRVCGETHSPQIPNLGVLIANQTVTRVLWLVV